MTRNVVASPHRARVSKRTLDKGAAIERCSSPPCREFDSSPRPRNLGRVPPGLCREFGKLTLTKVPPRETAQVVSQSEISAAK